MINTSASFLYTQKTNKKQLYNIMPIDNIPSVIQHGILSYNAACNISHKTVAMNEIQERRERVVVTGGLRLHDYANLYFAFDNPMMYKRRSAASELSILAVSPAVMDIEGCVVSDMNASKDLVRFFDPYSGIEQIKFENVFSRYWTNHENLFDYEMHKAQKCAEVLIPHCIDYSYVTGACVKDEQAKQRMIGLGFNKSIIIKPENFYA